jgi:hypothetical protein
MTALQQRDLHGWLPYSGGNYNSDIISFFSCRNRHCPKCQVNAREKWLRKRQQELLPVGYYHIVFSVPHRLIPVMWQNKKLLFSLLFQAAGSALLEVAANPKRLGVQIGFLCILHTWGQTLNRHPHIHCVVPGGGLSHDHSRWISSHPRFFLPVKVLSSVFRDKFLAGLVQAYLANKLRFYGDCQTLTKGEEFAAFLNILYEQDWVVYAKPPFAARNTYSSISPAIPIAWPYPTIESSRSTTLT